MGSALRSAILFCCSFALIFINANYDIKLIQQKGFVRGRSGKTPQHHEELTDLEGTDEWMNGETEFNYEDEKIADSDGTSEYTNVAAINESNGGETKMATGSNFEQEEDEAYNPQEEELRSSEESQNAHEIIRTSVQERVSQHAGLHSMPKAWASV